MIDRCRSERPRAQTGLGDDEQMQKRRQEIAEHAAQAGLITMLKQADHFLCEHVNKKHAKVGSQQHTHRLWYVLS